MQAMRHAPHKLITPQAGFPTSLKSLVQSYWQNRQLMGQLTKREVIGRYKGSALGLMWSFLHPLFMLAVFTFVFSVVFKARWGVGEDESKTQFAIVLYAGLIVHGLFSEVLNRTPNLILSNSNFVKKIMFPLEILPGVAMGAALFHSGISLVVLLLAFLILKGFLYWTMVLTPLVLLPLVLFSLGIGWMLASLGVFLRDVGQTIQIVTMLLLFLSPIFYPITALPEAFRPWILLNPLTFIIEQTRAVLVWGQLPNWMGLGVYGVLSVLMAWTGYWWFQKTRKGFADVL